MYGTTPKAVLNFLADVYWEDFTNNYAENDKVLDLSFDGLEGMEYLDVKDYLQMQAYKLKNYLPGYSSESSSFRAEGSEETFPEHVPVPDAVCEPAFGYGSEKGYGGP